MRPGKFTFLVRTRTRETTSHSGARNWFLCETKGAVLLVPPESLFWSSMNLRGLREKSRFFHMLSERARAREMATPRAPLEKRMLIFCEKCEKMTLLPPAGSIPVEYERRFLGITRVASVFSFGLRHAIFLCYGVRKVTKKKVFAKRDFATMCSRNANAAG